MAETNLGDNLSQLNLVQKRQKINSWYVQVTNQETQINDSHIEVLHEKRKT